jgi:hypothetical protein
MPWRVVTYRLGRQQSRHRVGVWRELRRVGAVALQSATWAIPVGDHFDEGLAKAVSLVERGNGQILVFDVAPSGPSDVALEQLYTAEREAEWAEQGPLRSPIIEPRRPTTQGLHRAARGLRRTGLRGPQAAMTIASRTPPQQGRHELLDSAASNKLPTQYPVPPRTVRKVRHRMSTSRTGVQFSM